MPSTSGENFLELQLPKASQCLDVPQSAIFAAGFKDEPPCERVRASAGASATSSLKAPKWKLPPSPNVPFFLSGLPNSTSSYTHHEELPQTAPAGFQKATYKNGPPHTSKRLTRRYIILARKCFSLSCSFQTLEIKTLFSYNNVYFVFQLKVSCPGW